MSAAAPNPNNLLILAVVGIGAFWFMSRRAVAQPVGLTTQQQADRNAQAQKAGLLAAGLNAVTSLFGGVKSTGTQDAIGRTLTQPFVDQGYLYGGSIGGVPTLLPEWNQWSMFGSDALAMNPAGGQDPYGWWSALNSGGQ